MPTDPGRLPGRVVTAGGRAVHVVEQDGASPTVLLLGGCGVPFYVWDPVVALLADRRDRPDGPAGPGGYAVAWSAADAGRGDRHARRPDRRTRVARRWSWRTRWAGCTPRAWPGDSPTASAALVLVDGSVEREPTPPGNGDGWRRLAAAADRVMRLVPPTRSLGSFADGCSAACRARRLRLTTPRPAAQRAVYREPDAIASVIAEQAAYAAQVADLAALRKETAWPGLPVRVLTAAGEGGESWVQAQAWLAEQLRAEHTRGRRLTPPDDARPPGRHRRRRPIRCPDAARRAAQARAEDVLVVEPGDHAGPDQATLVGDPRRDGATGQVAQDRSHGVAVVGVDLGQLGGGVDVLGVPDPFQVAVRVRPRGSVASRIMTSRSRSRKARISRSVSSPDQPRKRALSSYPPSSPKFSADRATRPMLPLYVSAFSRRSKRLVATTALGGAEHGSR